MRDHVRGDPSSTLVLLEYADYECPFCRRAWATVHALIDTLGDRLCYVMRNFPLAELHAHALAAADAAEAAGAQGRFWEMHDLLFQHQDALESHDLIRYAATLDLDLDRFAADLAGHRHRDKIRADVRAGALAGVTGTPTLFVNGARWEGGYDLESLFVALGEAPPAHV